MSARSPLAAPWLPGDTSRPARSAIGESLLLRFLVQRGIVQRSLLKLIEIERTGSGTTLSLVDWLVQRGHVSEEALTSVLAACLRLHASDLAPFALDPVGTARTESPTRVTALRVSKPRHLRLVSCRK